MIFQQIQYHNIISRLLYYRGHAMWRRGSINCVTSDKIFLNKTKYKKYLEVFRFVLHCVLNKYHCLAHSIITRDQTYPSFGIHTPNTRFNNISHVTRFPPKRITTNSKNTCKRRKQCTNACHANTE